MSEYSEEMHGSVWIIDDSDRKDRGPVATGFVTISGVKLRIAMWPKKKVAKPGSKADGKVYMPISIEYQQGATRFLVPVKPENVIVKSADAEHDQCNDSANGEDIPF